MTANTARLLPIFLPITKTLNIQKAYEGAIPVLSAFCGSVRRRLPKALNSLKNTKGYVVSERFLSCHYLL